MTRDEFLQLKSNSICPVVCSIDMNVRTSVPNIYGCIKENGRWIVYRNDYKGNVKRTESFYSEEEAFEYLAKKIGIRSDIGTLPEPEKVCVVPVARDPSEKKSPDASGNSNLRVAGSEVRKVNVQGNSRYNSRSQDRRKSVGRGCSTVPAKQKPSKVFAR